MMHIFVNWYNNACKIIQITEPFLFGEDVLIWREKSNRQALRNNRVMIPGECTVYRHAEKCLYPERPYNEV